MLFVLDDDVANLDLDDPNHSGALENILAAHYSGSHIVVGSRDLFSDLAHEERLSRRARAAAKSILNRFAELGSLPEDFRWFVHLSFHGQDASDSRLCCRMNLLDFQDLSLVGPTALLGENMVDSEVLSYVAEHVRILRGLKGIKVNAALTQGGGSTTSATLREERRFCLCIVDSDSVYVNDRKGETARDCERVAAACVCTKRLVVLRAHELENIVPLRLLSTLEIGDADTIALLKKIREQTPADVHLFLDLKEGMHAAKLFERLERSSEGAHVWTQTLSNQQLFPSVNQGCVEAWQCLDGGKCDCVIFAGVSKNLLSRVRDGLSQMSPHKSAESSRHEDGVFWREVGEEVLNWCCAVKPLRI